MVRALSDAGWRVRVLARRDPVDPLWRGITPEVVPGDLADPDALARLCRGADAVIHAAALVKAPSPRVFQAVNVEGARAVAAAAPPQAQVVLVSSLAAREPHLSPYAASKRAAEELLAGALGPRLTIARPPAIYGPGDRELLPVFQAAARSPVLPVFAPHARLAMIHVEDAARQVAALAEGSGGGRVVALSDARPEGYAWRELMAQAAAAVGRSPRLLPLPGALVRAAGITNDFTTFLGRVPMLTSGKARELLHPDWGLAPEERLSGLPSPAFTLAAGFAHTVEWYRRVRWMKH